MKRVVVVLLSIISIPLFLILLLSSFLKLKVLNENFWIDSYRKPGFYETLKENTDRVAEMYVKNQLRSQGIPESSVSDTLIESEVKKMTASLTKDDLQVILEENTRRLIGFINGREKSLIVYVPLEDFEINLNSGALESLAVGENEYDISKLANHPIGGSAGFLSTVGSLKLAGSVISALFFTTILLLVLILFLVYKASSNLKTPGKLLMIWGIFGLIFYLPFYYIQQGPGLLAGSQEPLPIIASSFLPSIYEGIRSTFLVYSFGAFGAGVILYALDKLRGGLKKEEV